MVLANGKVSYVSRRKKSHAVAVPKVNLQEKIQPRGLRVDEAACYLGSTVSFVRSLIRTREIPAIMLGKRYVLLKDDLDSYLDARRRRA